MNTFLLKKSFDYLSHLYLAQSSYYIHSPFIFDFYNKVLKGPAPKNSFQIETLRNKLLKRHDEIEVQDLGSGSKVFRNKKRRISDIVKYNAISAKQGNFISRLVKFINPNTILEYGTSLGLSTMYLANEKPEHSILYSMEGDSHLCALAQNNLSTIDSKNVHILNGEFSQTFNSIKKDITSLDIVYFDGNHHKQASLEYFQACLPLAHENSVFIFDDIRWTNEMCEAWSEIKAHPKVSVSLDLFSFGLIFFRNQAKQHFNFIL